MDKPVSLAKNAKAISKLVVALNMQRRLVTAIKTTKPELDALKAVEEQKEEGVDPPEELQELMELMDKYEAQLERVTAEVESTSTSVVGNLNSILGKKKGTLSRIITEFYKLEDTSGPEFWWDFLQHWKGGHLEGLHEAWTDLLRFSIVMTKGQLEVMSATI
jgi:hypothetical protein